MRKFRITIPEYEVLKFKISAGNAESARRQVLARLNSNDEETLSALFDQVEESFIQPLNQTEVWGVEEITRTTKRNPPKRPRLTLLPLPERANG